MRLNGHLYLVTGLNGRATAKRMNELADQLARYIDHDQLIVSARDEETALKIARVIQTASRARELVTDRDAAFREGYAAALGALKGELRRRRIFHADVRPPSDVTPEAAKESGRWFGIEDMLDEIERWAGDERRANEPPR